MRNNSTKRVFVKQGNNDVVISVGDRDNDVWSIKYLRSLTKKMTSVSYYVHLSTSNA